jgi:hypothetical protein
MPQADELRAGIKSKKAVWKMEYRFGQHRTHCRADFSKGRLLTWFNTEVGFCAAACAEGLAEKLGLESAEDVDDDADDDPARRFDAAKLEEFRRKLLEVLGDLRAPVLGNKRPQTLLVPLARFIPVLVAALQQIKMSRDQRQQELWQRRQRMPPSRVDQHTRSTRPNGCICC